ncbi:MAG TPA: nucleoside-diphosphate sugar epimerase/dehydratase [Parafilimonas sp.]|nr:nucleoside-diphosphate sugar epimerase/dehydratase [Parafilimonas sp.]
MYRFRKFLLSNRITPKWAIFTLDLFVGILCFIYANYLLSNFRVVSVNLNDLTKGVLLIAIIASSFSFIFKTYDGIIRLSAFQESLRSITAIFCTSFLIFILNVFLDVLTIPTFAANSSLIIYFFTTSFLLCGYRIFVRQLYLTGIQSTRSENVVIFGVSADFSLLKNTMETISDSGYQVVAFIDDDERYIGKMIDGIRIHSVENIGVLLDTQDVSYLFFADPSIRSEIKNKLVDVCFAHQIKVLNIPPAKDWIHGNIHINQFQEVTIDELLNRPPILMNNSNVTNYIRNKKVLITGAAGSIGSELAKQIAAMGPEVLILCDKFETGLHDLEYALHGSFDSFKLKPFLVDVKDHYALQQVFNQYRPEIVFHAAAYKHVPIMEKHPSEAIRNNVLGTKIVANLSVMYGVEKFLFVSTDKAINPTNIMGASKRLAEIYCSCMHNMHHVSALDENGVIQLQPYHQKTQFITTRFGNVLASNGSVIPRFREQIANGGPVTVTHPEVIRYFMTISEACSLVLEAATMGNGGEIFLFDMGKPVKIIDMARKMIRLAGYEPGKEINIVFTGLRPGEKLYEELLNKQEEVIPTHHHKILAAKTSPCNYVAMQQAIDRLLHVADTYNDEKVVQMMKSILPEFISNNSVYEMYDDSPADARISSV